MRTFFIFLLTTKFTCAQTIDIHGRTIEQNALDYLICNLSTLELNYSAGCFKFNPDSNKIWYRGNVWYTREVKVRIPKGYWVTDTQFHYAICDKKDIFIVTFLHKENTTGFSVHFSVVTQTNHFTGYTVLIDKKLIPYKIQDDEFISGHASETHLCVRNEH